MPLFFFQQWNGNGSGKQMMISGNAENAAIFFYGIANAFQAIAVVSRVGLGGYRQIVLLLRNVGQIVFHVDHIHIALPADKQINDALIRFGHRFQVFHSVFDQIA